LVQDLRLVGGGVLWPCSSSRPEGRTAG